MKKALLLACLLLALASSYAQDDLLSLLGDDQQETDYATASFKTNRIINLHSLENTAGGVLDFKINHRFGTVDQGVYDLFGLDGATIRLALDYGITDRLQVGLARSTYQKNLDGYVKYKILRQSKGMKNMPITLAAVAGASMNTLKWADTDRENFFSHRLAYLAQILIGRKLSEGTSVQLTPTMVHRNLVPTRDEPNDVFALGIGLRQKITKRIAINAEYIPVLNDALGDNFHNSFSIGFDIETGGHVFQLHFTNSAFMFERAFIAETTDEWFDSGIHFGFNLSRVFTLSRKE